MIFKTAFQITFKDKNSLVRHEVVQMLLKSSELVLCETFSITILDLPVESKFLDSSVNFAQIAVILDSFEVFVTCLHYNSRLDRQSLLFLILEQSDSVQIKFLQFLLDFDPYLDLISPSSVVKMTPLKIAYLRSKDAF